jgi:hypothetical protein
VKGAPLVLTAFLALTTACGSTVSTTSTGAPAGSAAYGLGDRPGDGLGAELGGSPVAGAAVPGGALNDPTSVSATTPDASSTAPPGANPGAPAAGGAAGTNGVPTTTVSGQAASNIPGVTPTSITIGVLAADPQANESLESAGFGAASLGDEPASWRSMADQINERGGVAGRKVKLIFHLVNLTDPPAQQGQEGCAKFTQDNKVAIVLSGYYYSSLHTCLSKVGVPALLGTNYGVDSTLAKSTSTVAAWATPLLDRLAATLPSALRSMGTLKSGTTAGIFVVDSPPFTRSARRLEQGLERHGVKVLTQFVRDSDSGDYSGAASDASAAVLRFRSEGVTEVLFLTRNAFEPTTFMQAANSQNYRPTYLLSSQQYPNALAGLVPPSQLDGALGVGWAPALDLSAGFDSGPQAESCLRNMRERGRSYNGATQVLVALLVCDAFDLFKRAAEGPDGLASRDTLLRSALRANGFVSAVTIKTAFPGGRRDGVAGYRPLAFNADCGCFRYFGPSREM